MGETHEAFESYKFHLRKQEPTENIETYVVALSQLAKNCNFGQLRDRLIRDQVVVGVRNCYQKISNLLSKVPANW